MKKYELRTHQNEVITLEADFFVVINGEVGFYEAPEVLIAQFSNYANVQEVKTDK